MKFGLFKKKVENKVFCSACRRDLSEGKTEETITWCNQEDPRKPVYFFHPKCVSDGIDIARAVSTKTVQEKGWIPQPY